MGYDAAGLARGESSKLRFIVTVIAVILIGVLGSESSHAFAIGNWIREPAPEAPAVLPSRSWTTSTAGGNSPSNVASNAAASKERIQFGNKADLDEVQQVLVHGADDEISRRMLSSHAPFYVGYGALSAGYTPCRPRSGRSYYTPSCRGASGPVRPYSRGCTTISRCARG